MEPRRGRVTVFGPSPLLSVTIEARPGAQDDIHLHPAGQGVWLTRSAGELGAHPVLCGLTGGETGAVLAPLLDSLPGERRLVATATGSGCYVMDRREGERQLVSQSLGGPFSRHELDDLFSATCASALSSAVLAVCNPLPGDALPLEMYGNLVADARANGATVIVDLSTPRLDSALEGSPDLVKVNDWELAEFVVGPVDTPERMRAATERLLDRGARAAVVTRGGESAFVLIGDRALELVPPKLERGFREGCGDAMMGGVAAALALGEDLERALVLGAGAGAATFLRHGLGTGTRAVVEELAPQVELRPLGAHSARLRRNPRPEPVAPADDAPQPAPDDRLSMSNDSKRVLVLFASTHGQTERIAERLAATLREQGAEVDIHDLARLPSGFSLKPYTGVVLGASVHGGKHLPAAVEFAHHHHGALESVPSAFFSVSLTAADSDDESLAATRDYLDTFLEDTEWQPSLKASFAGAFLYSRYGVFERALMRLIATRRGHGEVKWDQEYTDWDAVDRFAREFASELAESKERSRVG